MGSTACGNAIEPWDEATLTTRAADSVLFFGCSLTQYNHLAVSLHNASLHVSVVFVDQHNYDELWLAIGTELNDNRWHRVLVSHRGEDVQVLLDGEEEHISAPPGNQHLHMDPAVYFGGLDLAHTAMGLRSQSNFVGCMRDVYFNHNSVLERIGGDRSRYHGDTLLYGCQDISQSILQFSHEGAFLKVEHSTSNSLEVALHFRTLKPDSLLVYTETTSSGEMGYIQVLLRNGQIEVLVVPSVTRPSIHQAVSIGEHLADNSWHSVTVHFQGGATRVDVDGEQSLTSFPWQLHIRDASYFGFGPDTHMKDGYVGCLKDVTIQQRSVDAARVVRTQLAVGVTLGPCDLQDLCSNHSDICLNGGICVSAWQTTNCDCAHVPYEGRYCQFATAKRTCDEYFRLGERRSGVWVIDVDGSDPLTPSHVTCQMGMRKNEGLAAVTWVDHNLRSATPARGVNISDHRLVVKYREFDDQRLRELVSESAQCQQWIHVNCSSAPLRLGELSWLSSPVVKRIASLGSTTDGACGCAETDACIGAHARCSCDQGLPEYLWDGGFIKKSAHLPVTQLSFRHADIRGHSNVTLGPLQCWGSRREEPSATASFTTQDAYLRASPWAGGALEFQFQTRQPDGVLLFQPSENEAERDNWTKAQFYVLLHTGDTLVVMLGSSAIWQTIKVSEKLDNGDWHRMSVEAKKGQLKVTVNSHSFLSDHQGVQPEPELPAKAMYIGGKPRGAAGEAVGFVGCMRGVRYAGQLQQLATIPAQRADVLPGCHPSCHSNPCDNNALCEENWQSYTCKCRNPRTQSGKNCENDINDDEVTFLSEAAYLKVQQTAWPFVHLLTQVIMFSFRTHQLKATLLHIDDDHSNFLRIGLSGKDTISVQCYYAHGMMEGSVYVKGISQGRWHQLVLTLSANNLTVEVDDNLRLVSLSPEADVTTMTSTRKHDARGRSLAKVNPAAVSHVPGNIGYAIFVGGYDVFTTGTLPGLVGCLRGLRVGKDVFDLAKAARAVEGAESGCPLGCASNPCSNGGDCSDGSGVAGYYECDCAQTGYAGLTCNQEIGMYFDGDAFVSVRTSGALVAEEEEDLDAGSNDVLLDYSEEDSVPGTYEWISFRFATYVHEPRPQIMISARAGEGQTEGLAVYLNQDRQVGVHYKLDGNSVELLSGVHYTSGWPHHVTMTREGTQLTLQVDHSVAHTTLNTSLILGRLFSVTVGGLPSDRPLALMGNFSNFTGDLSDVFFISDWLRVTSIRPLEKFLDAGSSDDVIVAGTLSPPTQSLSVQTVPPGPVYLMDDPGDSNSQVVTFPPWNPGPAETMTIVESSEPMIMSNTAGNILGYSVCVVVFLVLGGTMAYILWRAHRHKPQVHRCSVDEEEGLIRTPTSPAVASGNGQDGSKRSGRRKKSPGSTEISADDEETEETPMLSGVEDEMTSDAADDIELAQFPKLPRPKSGVPTDDGDDSLRSCRELGEVSDIYEIRRSDLHIPGARSLNSSISVPNSATLEWDDEDLGTQLLVLGESSSSTLPSLSLLTGHMPNMTSGFSSSCDSSADWTLKPSLTGSQACPLAMSTPACRRAYGDASDQDIQYSGGILASPGVYTLGGAADLDSSFDCSDHSRSIPMSLDGAMESLTISSSATEGHSESSSNKHVVPVIVYNQDNGASLDYTGSSSSWELNGGPNSPPISIVSNGQQNAFTLDDHDSLDTSNGLAGSPDAGTSPAGMRSPRGVSPGVRQSAGKQRMNSKRRSKRKK